MRILRSGRTGWFPAEERILLVRWHPPYQFSMVEVRDQPSKACTEEDRDSDDEVRSLFPDFDWR